MNLWSRNMPKGVNVIFKQNIKTYGRNLETQCLDLDVGITYRTSEAPLNVIVLYAIFFTVCDCLP